MHCLSHPALTRLAAGLYALVAVLFYAPTYHPETAEPPSAPTVAPAKADKRLIRPSQVLVVSVPSRQDDEVVHTSSGCDGAVDFAALAIRVRVASPAFDPGLCWPRLWKPGAPRARGPPAHLA